jgi:cold shock CspA family protein
MTELRGGSTRHGVVASFDETVGLGSVSTSDDTAYEFHCIEIADGSRSIEVGLDVSFYLLAKLGRYEAANIRPRAHRETN